MIKGILVALDGSEPTRVVVEHAIRFAQATHAELQGLGIVDVPTITQGASAPVGGASFRAERDETLIRHAHEFVDRFLAEFADQCRNASLTFDVLKTEGMPFSEINKESIRHDLVMIARDSCFHFETTTTTGETLGRLINDSPRPLYVVSKAGPGSGPTIISTDGASAAARATQMFAQMRVKLDQPVIVTSVSADRQKAIEACQPLSDYLKRHDYDVTVEPLEKHGRESASLATLVERSGASLVVMGAASHGLLANLILGSTTRNVMQAVDVPVFVDR